MTHDRRYRARRVVGRRSHSSRPEDHQNVNQAFLVSTGAVALAEIGDKTQLLSLVLAARYRKPMPIILGVLVATLVNHSGAGALGTWLGALVTPSVMRWALAASFVAMGLWILVPDKLDEGEANVNRTRLGVFGATVVTFFLAEMGDKTQIATVALAARFHDFFGVVAGTTLGMMIANVPAILLGDRFAHKLPTKLVHGIAAVLFVVLGVLAIMGVGV
ncbi:TMEM165/GDT1 family protein [Paraburkholderia silviterrae]|uniref:GDT1 family protein n=1 Tax=Paraburkholderia silviterrae TaxID=2528715 RepID=A0A4R5ME32_9BURK|nr:TMEM165/GDT1 family protein [Paraburkholderia silviterrae]